jgi:putative Mn2+ efflux pump MntP
MNFLEIFIIAVGLAMDAFAVSLSAGATGYLNGPRPIFRISFHFGFFQFLMPIIGWYLGFQIANQIAIVDHWIAFGLLSFVGFRMIRDGIQPNSKSILKDPSRGKILIMLSIATSIDAFAIGFSLAILNVQIWYPSFIIGIITAGLSLVGIWFGNKFGKILGKKMEIIGGLLLIFIGLKIVISHLF